MLGENSLMYDIHKCTVVLCKFMYSRRRSYSPPPAPKAGILIKLLLEYINLHSTTVHLCISYIKLFSPSI